MKLTVFQSDKGDCLLIEGSGGGLVFADGGMRSTYTKHVAPYLASIRKKKKKLDAVYVSHIDEDHIDGILRFMEDEVEWRTYDYQRDPNGGNNKNAKKPRSLRPPEVGRVWHNAFHEQVEDNTGAIEDMIAATATILAGADGKDLAEVSRFHQNLASSVRQAIILSRQLGSKQLNLSLNPEAKGRLMMMRPKVGKPIRIGSMDWTIIGPAMADLEKLRSEWNAWLDVNQKALQKIDEASKKRERNLGNRLAASVVGVRGLAAAQAGLVAADLQNWAGIDASKKKKFVLGDRKGVTAPNLASLMFLIEEADASGVVRRVLMTGDGHSTDIIKGLEKTKHLKPNGAIRVDVLKVQHHGAEYNLDEEFCKRVIADHYVFCGNGAHHNPDHRVVEAIVNSRVSAAHQGPHPEVAKPFKLWFNSSSSNPDAKTDDNAQMKKLETLVAQMSLGKTNRIKSFFLSGSKFDIKLGS
jgi:hypothetical protein